MFVKFAALTIIGIFASAASCTAAEPSAITISDARATMVSPTLGAAYGTITSTGKDTLVGVSSDCCTAVEIHQSGMLNGVMSMRKISKAEVSPKKPLALISHAKATGPTSMHLMLIGAKEPLKSGDSVDVTLRFEKAGDVQHRFPIEAVDAH
jgi:hypothetical protein